MENVDGFVFKRNVRHEEEVEGGCKKKKMDMGDVSRSGECVFSFKFTKCSRAGESRVGSEECGKKTGEEKETEEETGHHHDTVGNERSLRRSDAHEIHLRLDEESTLDDLVALCVSQLSKTRRTPYVVDLENVFRQNKGMIKRRDISRETEEVVSRISWIDCEERKWKSLKTKVQSNNKIEVRELGEGVERPSVEERMESVKREFLEMSGKLEFLKECARLSIAHVREQSEGLLRKILDTVCKDKEVDTFFLLQTLSRTSK